MASFQSELDKLKDAGLYRQTYMYERDGIIVKDEDKELIDFSSNDYLGLSRHPKLIEAAKEAVERFGVGSSASRLVSGTSEAHESCEAYIAEKKSAEAALLFSSGYMTAIGVIPSVVGKEDVIIMDKLAHACLIDAARSSGARLRVFPHNNTKRLKSLLKTEKEKIKGRILIIVESVYSMDGDLCPLIDIIDLKEKYGAMLLVDEAHGLGVLGENGMGLAEELGEQQSRIDFQMGTLGKAAGGAGGYVATSKVLRDIIVNKGRSFIFTTAPPPAQAAVAQKAFEIISTEEGATLRKTLHDHRSLLGNAINGIPLPSAICPIIVGRNEEALKMSAYLKGQGFLVPAIRYPTVARGSARLRVALSAAHTKTQVEHLLASLR